MQSEALVMRIPPVALGYPYMALSQNIVPQSEFIAQQCQDLIFPQSTLKLELPPSPMQAIHQ